MKDIVHPIQCWWQSQTISNSTNPFQNLERTNETRLQLPSLPKPNNALSRRDLQKHMVAHLKGQVLPPNICITLLSALGRQQPLPDQLDLLRTVLNQLGSKQPALANL